MQLDELSERYEHATTETSQRFLTGAFDAVNGVLESLETVRQVRREAGVDVRGRLPHNEADLLRAAIVFAGAGLDASLKQLIRDALPSLLDKSDQAHSEFETFAERNIRTADGTSPKAVARYLIAADARSLLIEDYVYKLTGSSLQSADEVLRACAALGIQQDRDLVERVLKLKEMFTARNEVSHELDLQRPERQGDMTRRSRRMSTTTDMCSAALEAGQQIINAVGQLLNS